MEFTVTDYIFFGYISIVVIVFISYFIYKLIKHKSLKKALKDTEEFANDLYSAVNSEKFLKLKDKCKNFIYNAEKLYSSYTGKAGVFKLDSVLKDIQIACMQENVEYNEEEWKKFISDEVSKMKEVK